MLSTTSRLCLGRTSFTQFKRWMSETLIPKLGFPEVKTEMELEGTVLIDVREREELQTDGKIPKSKNIPLGEVEKAFQLSEEAFKNMYGFDKPSTEQTLITHCRMGMRAMKAAIALNQVGFQTVKVYSGMQDWVENGGPLEK